MIVETTGWIIAKHDPRAGSVCKPLGRIEKHSRGVRAKKCPNATSMKCDVSGSRRFPERRQGDGPNSSNFQTTQKVDLELPCIDWPHIQVPPWFKGTVPSTQEHRPVTSTVGVAVRSPTRAGTTGAGLRDNRRSMHSGTPSNRAFFLRWGPPPGTKCVKPAP